MFDNIGFTIFKDFILAVKRYKVLLLPIGLLFFSSCEQESIILHPNQRIIQLGDDLSWAHPSFDDSDWDKTGNTFEIGQFWVRFHIDFDDRIHLLNHKGIQMISLGSYEAYWDGVLIHKNGKVADNKADEIEGTFISQILIPDSLCQEGPHILALRLSNFHNTENESWSWNTCKVEEFNHSIKRALKTTAVMSILGGGFIIVAIYYFLLFFNDKRDGAKLVFSIMCLLFFLLMVFEYMKFYYSYAYSFHNTRLVIIGSLTAVISYVVPLFLCLHFDIPRKRILLGVLLIVFMYVGLSNKIKFDTTAQWFSTIMLGSSFLISSYAFWYKKRSSFIMVMTFALIALINYFSTFQIDFMLYNYDINLFLSFLILVLAILYTLSQQRKEQKKAYEVSLLLSERLKNELLKKNIQPHFIMNTLTSIMEWVERSPQKSIEFIEALAGEFDLLNDMADQQLIPIQQEIDLCKKHLEIMAFRKELKYLWEDENIDIKKEVPPAIFHTIIENGITHSKANDEGQIKFKLSEENLKDTVTYIIEVWAKNRVKNKPSRSGTGFKYIKSRLTESYGDAWDLESYATDTGWITKVTIQKTKN